MLYTIDHMQVSEKSLAVSNRTNLVISRVATLFTLIAASFGALSAIGFGSSSHNFIGQLPVLAIGLSWVIFSLWQFGGSSAFRVKPKAVSVMRLTVFHIYSAIYLLAIVDFASPLLYIWSFLIVASYLYLGSIGTLGSILTLYAVMTANIVMTNSPNEAVFEMILGTLIAISVGLVTIYVIRSTQTDQAEMDRSRAQVELQKDRTLTLINNLADAVVSTDRFGTITLYNAALLNLLDTNDNIAGQNIDRVISISSNQREKLSCWELLRKSSTVTVRDDLIAKVGKEKIRLEITFSPIRGNYSSSDDTNELGGYVIILRDVTKSKSLEEERDEFISVVSHELRTPITIAEGTLSNVDAMMSRSGSGTINTRLSEAVKMAHDQVIFLARMVNDLSTLSRAERGAADETEEIDIDSMVHDLFKEYHPEAEQKQLAFDLNITGKIGSVMASRLYLKELLQNFVTNAIKYTNEGGVTVKVRRTKNNIVIAVTDTGIGMSKADQKRIFDKFYRAEDYRTRETSGTGLGLYVAEKLAKKLGTTIDISSRLNHGSTFSISLPVYEPSEDSDDKTKSTAARAA